MLRWCILERRIHYYSDYILIIDITNNIKAKKAPKGAFKII